MIVNLILKITKLSEFPFPAIFHYNHEFTLYLRLIRFTEEVKI